MPPTPNLEDLALKLAKEGPFKTLPTPRLIRLLFNGEYIAQTTAAQFVWEHPYYPHYYLPKAALLESTAKTFKAEQSTPIKDQSGSTIAHHYNLSVNNRSIPTQNCIIFSPDLSGPAEPLKNLVKLNFNAIDRWFEEDAPIYVHPKDPFKRIDILPSTRRVQVFDRRGGRQLADASSSMHLYETSLPVRYYLPMSAVDASVLRTSETRTRCPYKGEAEYYSVDLRGEGKEGVDGEGLLKDVVWYYERPIMESAKIEGLLCFYSEKVAIKIDGVWLEK